MDDTYHNRASSVVVTNVVLITFMGIFVLLRFWARVFLLHQVGLDDILIWVSALLGLVPCLTAILMTKHGLGYHEVDVSTKDLDTFLLLQFIMSLTYISSFVLAKLSFAVFYLRVIPTRGFRRLNYVIIAILIAQGIEETFVVIFACTPTYKYWTTSAPGKCLQLINFYYISFGVKLGTDLVLFLEPVPTLINLKLPWAKRIGLVVMFSLGLFACIISIIRATYLKDTVTDVTWQLIDPLNWSSAEVCSLIICACIPYARNFIAEIPLLSRALGLSSDHSKGYPSHAGQGTSIALQTQRAAYIQSRTANPGYGGGSVSAAATVTANTRMSATDSTEEIFPNYRDKNGGIVVSTDVKIAVEPHQTRSSYSGES